MGNVLVLAFAAALLLLAFFTGRHAEHRHYRSIRERERRFLHQPASTAKTWDTRRTVADAKLVVGSVVVSVDHFKRFLARFRLLVGGELHSYSPLIDRGRREAILRMKQACPGAHTYVNMRLETSMISSGAGRAVGTVEVLAYATAVTYADAPIPEAV